METRALKKDIERLEDELREAKCKLCNLHVMRLEYEGEISHLRAELAETKEKYAELLEKYVTAMEERAK